ncbi:MAG: BamA/TamA family outer membrane protein [Candidatus Krumholzibacteria bacterium]|nr:BamA/TamA family outer membrane protein [Candidatus Krumholzibacteria bacterium]
MFDFRFPGFRVSWGAVGICLVLFSPQTAIAQDTAAAEKLDEELVSAAVADTVEIPKGSTVFLPVIGYTPDTGLMLGGAAIRFFYLDDPGPETRPSTFSPTFIYTLKSQIMVFMGTDLNWDEGRSHAGIFPNYIKFPDQYYGIGRDVTLDEQEDYTPEQINLELKYDREILGHLRPGLYYRVQRHRLIKLDPDGKLANGSVNGTENSLVSLPGVSMAWDTRDNLWAPSRGLWAQLIARTSSSTFGSDYSFNQFIADFRGYLTLGENSVLAAQLLGTGLDGDPPFFSLPVLGGEEGLRGYRGGLFRDKTRVLGRVEYRRDRIMGRFGGAVFAGIGDVAPEVGKLTLAGNLWTAGFGVRYLLDEAEKLKIRLDFGWGNGDSGFYLTLGEAF